MAILEEITTFLIDTTGDPSVTLAYGPKSPDFATVSSLLLHWHGSGLMHFLALPPITAVIRFFRYHSLLLMARRGKKMCTSGKCVSFHVNKQLQAQIILQHCAINNLWNKSLTIKHVDYVLSKIRSLQKTVVCFTLALSGRSVWSSPTKPVLGSVTVLNCNVAYRRCESFACSDDYVLLVLRCLYTTCWQPCNKYNHLIRESR